MPSIKFSGNQFWAGINVVTENEGIMIAAKCVPPKMIECVCGGRSMMES